MFKYLVFAMLLSLAAARPGFFGPAVFAPGPAVVKVVGPAVYPAHPPFIKVVGPAVLPAPVVTKVVHPFPLVAGPFYPHGPVVVG
ncbi:neuropeptide-like 3 [Glossina fuscipes]|uniref:Neuropeptide-like 3 n=2 Tax=Nemorhina TaxID=44051 RepID=A0A8U0W7Y3_9MUSC|nr:neuropeptide-like 3 [Glossina fuscipes]